VTDLYNVAVDVRFLVDGKIEQEREIEELRAAADLHDFFDGLEDRVLSGGFAGMQITIESNVPSVLDAKELAASHDAVTWKSERETNHGM
jgi:hypothetical protein